ncbi:Hypothetical_protein [Hexamita inflata]|uniref:Hypothetical_protein n=1 Tax=Hexamita inflata TaxID=28002 RepID=A0ABP1HGZ0_9EUKA
MFEEFSIGPIFTIYNDMHEQYICFFRLPFIVLSLIFSSQCSIHCFKLIYCSLRKMNLNALPVDFSLRFTGFYMIQKLLFISIRPETITLTHSHLKWFSFPEYLQQPRKQSNHVLKDSNRFDNYTNQIKI